MVDTRSLIDRLRALKIGATPSPPAAADAAGGRAPAIPGKSELLPDGAVHVAECRLPCDGRHGRVRLDPDRQRLAAVAAAAARDPRFREIDPGSWVFIDTETTSLNSGAGVWVFMVGIGWFEGGEFLIRQFLLANPAGERSLLGAVHRRIRSAGALVSFHGKSFDAPRLDDRFRLSGLEPVLTGRPHLDLLHPLRRLHGHRLPDCRLRTIEEDVLGFTRVDDLPGAFCPEAYFAWLRRRPHRLADVFEHNRLDVLSLGALAGYLCAAYDGACGRASPLRAGLDWAEAGDDSRARALLVAAARDAQEAPVTVALSAARWLWRLGEGEDARRVLMDLAARTPADPRPGLALKRLERRLWLASVAAAAPPARRRRGARARAAGASMKA